MGWSGLIDWFKYAWVCSCVAQSFFAVGRSVGEREREKALSWGEERGGLEDSDSVRTLRIRD